MSRRLTQRSAAGEDRPDAAANVPYPKRNGGKKRPSPDEDTGGADEDDPTSSSKKQCTVTVGATNMALTRCTDAGRGYRPGDQRPRIPDSSPSTGRPLQKCYAGVGAVPAYRELCPEARHKKQAEDHVAQLKAEGEARARAQYDQAQAFMQQMQMQMQTNTARRQPDPCISPSFPPASFLVLPARISTSSRNRSLRE